MRESLPVILELWPSKTNSARIIVMIKNILHALKNYKEDFGLTRMALFIIFYNIIIFTSFGLYTGVYLFSYFIPIALSILIFYVRPLIVKRTDFTIFIINIVPLALTIILNYALVGQLDVLSGGFERLDPFFLEFDNKIFGRPIALIFEDFLRPAGPVRTIFYDLLMSVYFCYFLFPFYGGILFYRQIAPFHRYRIGRYFASMLIYYSLNYLLYLLVPVTGPQYYIPEAFTNPIPLSGYGYFLHSIINAGHPTIIDCFPSGHFGIAILVTIWLFQINHVHRFIMILITFCIFLGTLALRYHYTLDLVASIPMALICFKLGHLLYPATVDPTALRRPE